MKILGKAANNFAKFEALPWENTKILTAIDNIIS